MVQEISKSQIDRLGERLTREKSDDDLLLLEKYRQSFRTAHDFVYKEIREKLRLEPTKRRTKTTQSIVHKLQRESIRLTQIQDIAGCRIIAKDIANQDEIVQQLSGLFEIVRVIDRREKPSYGYRAVHAIVFIEKKAIEIQVRTALQHLWAELSEKYADIHGQEIKYGKGEEQIQRALTEWSSLINYNECSEVSLKKTENRLVEIAPKQFPANDREKQIAIVNKITAIIQDIGEISKENDDVKMELQLTQAIMILSKAILESTLRGQILEVEKSK